MGEGVSYPRDVQVLPGMPEGWKGVEKQYGPKSKTAGQVYVRYACILKDRPPNSTAVLGPKQVFEMDAAMKGYDFEKAYAEFMEVTKKRKEEEKQVKKDEALKRGEVKGEER